MNNCPSDGQYHTCKPMNGYTHIVGIARPEVQSTASQPVRQKVEARKSKGGAVLALLRRLKIHEEKGVPYSAINSYFRSEFKSGGDSSPFGMFTEILTYDPKSDPAKSYAAVYASINQYADNLDWLSLWDVIDGLTYD